MARIPAVARIIGGMLGWAMVNRIAQAYRALAEEIERQFVRVPPPPD